MNSTLIEKIKLAYNYYTCSKDKKDKEDPAYRASMEAILESDYINPDNKTEFAEFFAIVDYLFYQKDLLDFKTKLKVEFYCNFIKYLKKNNENIEQIRDIDVSKVLSCAFDYIDMINLSSKTRFSKRMQKQAIISLFTLMNMRKDDKNLTNGKRTGKRVQFPIVSELLEKTPGLAFGFQDDNYTATAYTGKTNSFTHGKISRNISKDTYFDIASITKLITVLTILDFSKENNIPLDKKISEIENDMVNSNGVHSLNENSRAININDYSLAELLSFYINPYTSDLRAVTSREEALAALHTYYISTNPEDEKNPDNYKVHAYNDTSYMMLTDIIPTLPMLRQNFLIKNNLNSLIVMFSDLSNRMQITGGNEEQTRKRIPNDYKCEHLEDYCNHAGYFATLKGLLNLLKVASSKLSDLTIKDYPEIAQYASEIKRGLGVYIWKEAGFDVTEVPDFIPNSIGIEGFTGVWGMTSAEMQMAIATNPLSTDCGTKPKGYAWSLDSLKRVMLETNTAIKILIKSLRKLGVNVPDKTFDVKLPIELSHSTKIKRIVKKQ